MIQSVKAPITQQYRLQLMINYYSKCVKNSIIDFS